MTDVMNMGSDEDDLLEGILNPSKESSGPPEEKLEADQEDKTEGDTEEKTTPLDKSEEDIEALSLTESENIKTFRNHYQKVKSEREEALGQVAESQERITQLETSLDELRANSGKGVYFNTDVPMDEFNPKEQLTKMKQEDPEYYGQLESAIKEEIFWPSVTTEFETLISQDLPKDDPRLDQALKAFDVVTQKAFSGLRAGQLFSIMEVIRTSPDIYEVISQRANNKSTYSADSPFTGDPDYTPANGSDVSAPQVQTVAQIAKEYELDPSETKDKAFIKAIQAQQSLAQKIYLDAQHQSQQAAKAVKDAKDEVAKLAEKRKDETKVSEEQVVKNAETKLNQYAEESIRKDVLARLGNAVGDKTQLLGKIEVLVARALKDNPKYQQARQTALGWFKQAQGTTNETRRKEWAEKGMKAIAAMAPLRLQAIDEESKDLIENVKVKAAAARKKSNDPKPREIAPGGNPTPPKDQLPPATIGDMASGKLRIMERARQNGLMP